MASTRKTKHAGAALKTRRSATARKASGDRADDPGAGVLSPELRRFFDAMASHFPGHVMQRLMRADGTVRYTYVSPGLSALGLDRDEILAAEVTTQDWVHPDDKARWRAALATSAAMLMPLDEEVRVIGNDGRLRWVRSIGNPRRLANGDVVWDGLALDVTEKREALEALRLAKAQADTAEAQKARLLAHLSELLEGPHAAVSALLDADPGDGAAPDRAVLEAVGAALDRVASVLAGADITPIAKAEARPDDPRIAALTPRQRQVLARIGEGQSNRDIATALGIAEGTVKLHVVSLLRELGLTNRTQAAAVALRAGIAAG